MLKRIAPWKYFGVKADEEMDFLQVHSFAKIHRHVVPKPPILRTNPSHSALLD